MRISDRTTKILFTILATSIVFILLLCAWSLKYDFFGNSLYVEKAFVCLELGDNREPLSVSTNIPYGARQVCLWFRYASAQGESYLTISWYLNNELVLSEQMKLIDKEGIKAFYLLKENGIPLSAGSYKVLISTPTKTLSEIPFIIN
ncbi:MAG: hypothetical protein GXZ18_03110 [Synergistaceae bacterium]|jgi:hypothetical protein|nr:hypothetical protein [Synergistaceae bacterium]